MEIRHSTLDDRPALVALDRATWEVTGAVAPPGDEWTRAPEDTLVAEEDGEIVGYVNLGHPTPLESNRHVAMIQGLAVLPAYRRRGIAGELMRAAATEAARRGARKLSLRVLDTNLHAVDLYERLGFEVEGRLVGEFHLGGQDVDDLIMAMPLVAVEADPG